MTLVHLGLCLGDCLWGRFFLCDLTPVVLINVRNSVTCTSVIYILWHVANLLLSFYLRLTLPIGINFSMWDFFFTWDRKFLTFYLNLSIIISYYTFFLVITVYIFFSTLYIKWIGWNLFWLSTVLLKLEIYVYWSWKKCNLKLKLCMDQQMVMSVRVANEGKVDEIMIWWIKYGMTVSLELFVDRSSDINVM